MNKKTLSLTLSSALASTLLSAAPVIQAGENPFAISSINPTQQLAAADGKSAEAGCSAKMPEAGCSGKMPEGSCSGKTAQ
jgi:hypothetical protein